MAVRTDNQGNVIQGVGTSDSGGSSNTNLNRKVTEALADDGNITTGKLLQIINESLPVDRQAIIDQTSQANQQLVDAPLSKVYTTLNYNNDIVITEQIRTQGLFPGGIGAITDGAFYSSSNQSTASKTYYITAADGSTTSSNDLFDISWGGLNAADSSSLAMYRQFANTLLDSDTTLFTISGSSVANSIIALSVKRANFKEKLDPGNWEFSVYSGSATMSFTDNSSTTTSTKTIVGERLNIVSGSINNLYSDTSPWGWVYPDLGIFILDGDKFSGSTDYSSSVDFLNNLDTFQARSEQRLKDINYFCRIYNKEYNYSNNPTFVTGSDGSFRFSTFSKEPYVYVTTIGLYNDNNELLAVARTSVPLQKNFSSERVVTVKLSF